MGSLTLAGLVLRLVVFGQSAYGDELSTLWIVRNNDLLDVVSIVHSDAEITPPLYFVLAELTSVFGPTISSVRLPSLLAGVATLPLVYLAGLRMIGRRGALAATVIATVSPFLIYFSAQARNYAVMILLLMLATLLILEATGERSRWWHWAGWALASALALYSQYTAGFVILAQVLWVLWFFPLQRLTMIAWTCGAGVLFLPWLTGLLADLDSPTAEIMQALQGDSFGSKRIAVEQLFFHRLEMVHPPLYERPDVIVAAIGGLAAAAAILLRLVKGDLVAPRGERARGLWLAVGMVASVFICMLVLLALGTDIFGARNLAPAWIGLPFLFGAAFVAAGRTAGIICLALVAGGFMISTVRMMNPEKSTIAFRPAADLIDDSGAEGTILDAAVVSPAPLTPLGAYVDADLPTFRMSAIRDRPDYVKELYATYDPQQVADEAFRTEGPVRVVTASDAQAPRRLPDGRYAISIEGREATFPPGWEPVSSRRFQGLEPLTVTIFEKTAPRGPQGEP